MVLFWIASKTGYVPVMVDPESIYHWHRLDDRITTSGQPSETQLADIAALGVRYVINLGLHSHEKALPDEAATVDALGMTYLHPQVIYKNPTERDSDAFATPLKGASDGPLPAHCTPISRVSPFFYQYRRTVLGMDAARARADLDQVWQPDPVWTAFINRAP